MHQSERSAHMRPVTHVSAAALAVFCIAGTSAPASADPTNAKNATVFDIVCDDGTSTQIVVTESGNWSPGHDLGSNSIFVPVVIGEITGTVTDAAGNVLETFTEPATTKGAGRNADLQCTFSGTFTFDDPALGLITVEVTGDVAGFHTPRR